MTVSIFSPLRAIVAAVIAAVATSCFTGIESTPRITDKEVSRRNVVVTEEDRWLADVTPQPLAQWQPGKQFYVTDSKISLALEPGNDAPAQGSVLRYLSSRPVTSLTGGDDTELVFASSSGGEAVYRINADKSELDTRRSISVPFTIEMSMVDSVRSRLVGRDLYVRTSLWYDSVGNAMAGLKYIPVKVIAVEPGNLVYPVKVTFSTSAGKECPDTASVFMSVGAESHSARNFAALFNFSNPRDRYPMITDANWERIIHGRVAVDMTRDECRLALGSPSHIDRYQGTSAYGERWTYENGVYLIFFDGILSSFRQ
ncbi:hypothetical protein [Muribaculum intestinale]|uniref:Lipoprotein n=1 Tax=Muribaculum intestinale TaxID=1796646 RepID=A0A4V3R7C0_9BACT|nr:hypothetical protein [Muribaculum intestinale]MYM11909.1 hypothetical protein [Muribaculum intestinale]TGX84791.1 hypothetical protein E5360_05645 [Muribaculum intestinale]TGY75691.1 hypothetical protein E5333_03315 [Muribaculum intestinale]